jgi:hypothetical protein
MKATAHYRLWLFLAWTSVLQIQAWVPPRNQGGTLDESWESVHEMRSRLGIDYNYTPSLLHPELCRYISEDECQLADESMQRHAESHQRRARQRRHLQRTQAPNPSLGKFKVLVLLVQFTDHQDDRILVEKSVIEDLWNGVITEWFNVNSYGAYEIEPVVIDWVLTGKLLYLCVCVFL